MKKLALITILLLASFASSPTRVKAAGCTYVFLDSHVDENGCVVEHYMLVCSGGGQVEVERTTCD